jgi:hypothetical protein
LLLVGVFHQTQGEWWFWWRLILVETNPLYPLSPTQLSKQVKIKQNQNNDRPHTKMATMATFKIPEIDNEPMVSALPSTRRHPVSVKPTLKLR